MPAVSVDLALVSHCGSPCCADGDASPAAASPGVVTLAPPGGVTLHGLLEEMVDPDADARWPSPAFTVRQASSHDRARVAPDQPGWFANNDSSRYIRTVAGPTGPRAGRPYPAPRGPRAGCRRRVSCRLRAQSLRQSMAVVPAPLGHRAEAPVAAEGGGAGRGGERAAAKRAGGVRRLGRHFDPWKTGGTSPGIE